jgi:hypothetical protein
MPRLKIFGVWTLVFEIWLEPLWFCFKSVVALECSFLAFMLKNPPPGAFRLDGATARGTVENR